MSGETPSLTIQEQLDFAKATRAGLEPLYQLNPPDGMVKEYGGLGAVYVRIALKDGTVYSGYAAAGAAIAEDGSTTARLVGKLSTEAGTSPHPYTIALDSTITYGADNRVIESDSKLTLVGEQTITLHERSTVDLDNIRTKTDFDAGVRDNQAGITVRAHGTVRYDDNSQIVKGSGIAEASVDGQPQTSLHATVNDAQLNTVTGKTSVAASATARHDSAEANAEVTVRTAGYGSPIEAEGRAELNAGSTAVTAQGNTRYDPDSRAASVDATAEGRIPGDTLQAGLSGSIDPDRGTGAGILTVTSEEKGKLQVTAIKNAGENHVDVDAYAQGNGDVVRTADVEARVNLPGKEGNPTTVDYTANARGQLNLDVTNGHATIGDGTAATSSQVALHYRDGESNVRVNGRMAATSQVTDQADASVALDHIEGEVETGTLDGKVTDGHVRANYSFTRQRAGMDVEMEGTGGIGALQVADVTVTTQGETSTTDGVKPGLKRLVDATQSKVELAGMDMGGPSGSRVSQQLGLAAVENEVLTTAEKYDQIVDEDARRNARQIVDDAHAVAAALSHLPAQIKEVKDHAQEIIQNPDAALQKALEQVDEAQVMPLYLDGYAREGVTKQWLGINWVLAKPGWLSENSYIAGVSTTPPPDTGEASRPEGLGDDAADRARQAGSGAGATNGEHAGYEDKTAYPTPPAKPERSGMGGPD